MPAADRTVWTERHVVDVRDAAFSARTYLEQRDVRSLLNVAAVRGPIRSACEVGSGYGRMTVVLTEYAPVVAGFEREAHFVEEAARLHPRISFTNVAALTALPAADASFDLVLTFTVLQHLTDAVAAETAREIDRITHPGGHLLVCEETDPAHRSGDVDDPSGMCTIGRTVDEYAHLFSRFALLQTRPRRIEPTYPRADVGTYLLFQKSAKA